MSPDENTDADGAPKLHIDSDWKAEAQAEKERLAAQDQARTEKKTPAGDARGLPEANLMSLVGLLASQALMGLGTMQDPQSGGVVIDLEGARFSIDLLEVLEKKTAGNLTDEESRELTQLLAELRNRFVQISHLVAQQAESGNLRAVAAGAEGVSPVAPPPAGGAPK